MMYTHIHRYVLLYVYVYTHGGEMHISRYYTYLCSIFFRRMSIPCRMSSVSRCERSNKVPDITERPPSSEARAHPSSVGASIEVLLLKSQTRIFICRISCTPTSTHHRHPFLSLLSSLPFSLSLSLSFALPRRRCAAFDRSLRFLFRPPFVQKLQRLAARA